MYICICNAVTESDVRRFAREGARSSLADLQVELGVGAGCGRCVATAIAIVEEETGRAISSPVALWHTAPNPA